MENADHSRRNFLTTAAVSTVMVLTAVPASAASLQDDPAIAAIAKHNEARAVLRKAQDAYNLVERELQAAGDLFSQVISRGNPYSGLSRPASKTHEEIDRYSPADLYPDDNRREHADLDAAIWRRDALLIPAQDALDEALDAARAALEELVETVPTTMPGVMALLKWQRDLWERESYSLETEDLSYICESIETALLNLSV